MISLPASVGGENDGWSFPNKEFCASFSWPQKLWPALNDDPFDPNTRQRQHSYGQSSRLGYDFRISTYIIETGDRSIRIECLAEIA